MRTGLVRWRRGVSSVLLVAQVAGCFSWRVEQIPPEQLLHDRAPAEVRVARADGTQLVLGRPRISGDSLTGVSRDTLRGVRLADISTIATRHGDVGKSVLVGLGIMGGVLAISLIAIAANPQLVGVGF